MRQQDQLRKLIGVHPDIALGDLLYFFNLGCEGNPCLVFPSFYGGFVSEFLAATKDLFGCARETEHLPRKFNYKGDSGDVCIIGVGWANIDCDIIGGLVEGLATRTWNLVKERKAHGIQDGGLTRTGFAPDEEKTIFIELSEVDDLLS